MPAQAADRFTSTLAVAAVLAAAAARLIGLG